MGNNVLLLTNETDVSVREVADFLCFVGAEVKYSLEEIPLSVFSLDLLAENDLIYEQGGHSLYGFTIKSFWYRKGDFKKILTGIDSRDNVNQGVLKSLNDDWSSLKIFLHFYFSEKRSLGSLDKELENNGLIDLFNVKKIGINIPATYIISDKKELKNIFEKHKNLITKKIKGNNYFKTKNLSFVERGTQKVTLENIEKLKDTFHPILVQEKLDKKYEIRSFYLKGKFYSMAIFSQSNKQTELDYRNYDREKPNRNVPYELPKELEVKLRKFMEVSELDTGSLDIVVTKDNRYVFLEVNPVGQFGWLSTNCNYYLEQKIAEYLSHGQEPQ